MTTQVSQQENGFSVGELAMVTTPDGVIPARILAFDMYNKCPIVQPELRMPMYVVWDNIRHVGFEDFVNRQPDPQVEAQERQKAMEKASATKDVPNKSSTPSDEQKADSVDDPAPMVTTPSTVK